MKSSSTHQFAFDNEALKLFENKGISNSVKVRRIIQLAQDLSQKPFDELKILDLGCGEGVYSLESGLRGATVTGLDGRDNRLKFGQEVSHRLGMNRVNFVVDDIRNVTVSNYGKFDVIYLLGLLYHLDEPELFDILKNLYEVCEDVLIIDTTIALSAPLKVTYDGANYYGIKYDEHQEGDDEDLKIEKRIMASIGNNQSFLPTKKSLVKFLNSLGFTSVFECYSPIETEKPESRITLIAKKGTKEIIGSYPFLNGLSENAIEQEVKKSTVEIPFVLQHNPSMKSKLKLRIDKFLAKRGYELRKKLDQ
jgi:SAM-dependent methyltransferase